MCAGARVLQLQGAVQLWRLQHRSWRRRRRAPALVLAPQLLRSGAAVRPRAASPARARAAQAGRRRNGRRGAGDGRGGHGAAAGRAAAGRVPGRAHADQGRRARGGAGARPAPGRARAGRRRRDRLAAGRRRLAGGPPIMRCPARPSARRSALPPPRAPTDLLCQRPWSSPARRALRCRLCACVAWRAPQAQQAGQAQSRRGRSRLSSAPAERLPVRSRRRGRARGARLAGGARAAARQRAQRRPLLPH